MIVFDNVSLSVTESSNTLPLNENQIEANINLSSIDILKNVSFNVGKGEIVLLLGQSGCGKTSILRIISSLIPNFYEGKVTGNIEILGRKTLDYAKPDEIGYVMQNPKNQFFVSGIAEEMVFTAQNLGLPKSEILNRMDQSLDALNARFLLDKGLVRKLSLGEKQKVAILETMIANPKIILLDEPSSNLDFSEVLKLKEQIIRWKKAGQTVIIAEHRLYYLWDIADKAFLFEKGTLLKNLNKGDLTKLTPKEISQFGLRSISETDNDPTLLLDYFKNKQQITLSDKDYIVINNFSTKWHKHDFCIEQISFLPQKINAIVAPNGTGKSMLLECLSGLYKFKADITEKGVKVKIKDFVKNNFLVFQDPNYQLSQVTALDEVLISFSREEHDKFDAKTLEQKAITILEDLNLKNQIYNHPLSLSGGQKQRLLLACAIASKKNMLLDEPTSGLDANSMNYLSKQLRSMIAKYNITIIIVSHDVEFIKACADTITNLELKI